MRDYEPYYTEDGSIGLYSYADKDVYHSKYGALTEAWEKFVLPSGINNLLRTQKEIKVLDICYGIGYNSKALMSYVIEKNSDKIIKKTIIKKLFNFVSIHINKLTNKKMKLLHNIETIYNDNNENFLNSIKLDCMDINEELVKLSPFFKTIKTPDELYTKIVPNVLRCFDTYYKVKNIFIDIASLFYPKNKKYIKDLLDIKFKNMHIDKEYRVNELVNYILLNNLYMAYRHDYYNDELKKILKDRHTSMFFSKSLVKYAKFNHTFGYDLYNNNILSTFLHNIYYEHLSKRNKNINFKAAQSLFNMTFYINDARKTIKQIKDKYDCIFLDAFSYTKAPQLWSIEFIAELYNHLNDTGVILTYSNSAQIRNTLLENKFYVGKILNKKSGKFIGTIASKDKSKIKYPLSNYELGLCNTKAGIPYHDPNLTFTNKEIMELREYEFKHSNLISSSKYMKIRSLRGDNE